MGRINYQDAEKYGNQDSQWLSLKDNGDSALVQFMNEGMEDLDVFAVHKVKMKNKDGKEYDAKVSCLREPGDPIDICPLCASGMKPQATLMLAMVDVDTNEIKIWERGKTFLSKMANMANRYNPISGTVFEIIRNGKKGDKGTTYDVIPVPSEEPVDISQFERPQFLGGVIAEKSAEEMEEYLQTGEFPRVEKEDDEPQPRQRGARRGASEEETPRSRGTGRGRGAR